MASRRIPAMGARALAAAFALAMAGCITPPGTVRFPEKAAAVVLYPEAPVPAAATGAIFDAASYRPLFEDARARRPGDILTVQLIEKTSASRKASSSTNRDGASSIKVGPSARLPLKGLGGMGFDGESNTSFEGKGETASDVLLSGTLTVTVTQVLPNGNFVVSGEKQIGVNRNVERLRLAGIVNPADIQAGNVVASPRIAEARFEVSGSGTIQETQTMGWLQRFFHVIWPL